MIYIDVAVPSTEGKCGSLSHTDTGKKKEALKKEKIQAPTVIKS